MKVAQIGIENIRFNVFLLFNSHSSNICVIFKEKDKIWVNSACFVNVDFPMALWTAGETFKQKASSLLHFQLAG